MKNLAVRHTASRRQLVTSSAVGALLGAAWGASFLEAELRSATPVITVYRTPGLFSMLIEMGSARVVVLDGPDVAKISESVERSMGFLRQRLDIILASDEVLRGLPGQFMDRWKVSSIFAAPDQVHSLATPLDSRAVSIGELLISASAGHSGDWITESRPGRRPWYADIRFRRSRCVYCSSMSLVPSISRGQNTGRVMALTNDTTTGVATNESLDIVGVPAELIDATNAGELAGIPVQVARLYRESPVTISLNGETINVPHEYISR